MSTTSKLLLSFGIVICVPDNAASHPRRKFSLSQQWECLQAQWNQPNEWKIMKVLHSRPRVLTGSGTHPPPIKWVFVARCTGYTADHSPPSSVKVKDVWSYTSTLPYAFRLQCLVKHRNNFTLCCYIPDANTAFKENYFHKIAIWTRMFRNNDSRHVLVNKLNPQHKQITKKEDIYHAVGEERIHFQSFCYPNTITNNMGISFY